jgi:hypothetical protein
MAPPETLNKLAMAGELGRNTRSAFYDYSHQRSVPNPEPAR